MMLDRVKVDDRSMDEKIEAAFVDAARDAIRKAREFGTPLVGWENGAIRHYTPDEYEQKLNESVKGKK